MMNNNNRVLAAAVRRMSVGPCKIALLVKDQTGFQTLIPPFRATVPIPSYRTIVPFSFTSKASRRSAILPFRAGVLVGVTAAVATMSFSSFARKIGASRTETHPSSNSSPPSASKASAILGASVTSASEADPPCQLYSIMLEKDLDFMKVAKIEAQINQVINDAVCGSGADRLPERRGVYDRFYLKHTFLSAHIPSGQAEALEKIKKLEDVVSIERHDQVLEHF